MTHKIILFFLLLKGISFPSKSQEYFPPYLDTVTLKYTLKDKKSGKSQEYDNLDFIIDIKDESYWHLNDEKSHLVLTDTWKQVYSGYLKPQNTFHYRKELFITLINKDRYKIFNASKNNFLDSSDQWTSYSVLKDNRIVLLTNHLEKRVKFIDMEAKTENYFNVSGHIMHVHHKGLSSKNLYYYNCENEGMGLFDLKEKKEILFDDIEYFQQLDESHVAYKKRNGNVEIVNVKTGEINKTLFEKIYKVWGIGKSVFVVVKDNQYYLCDSDLKIQQFENNFDAVYRKGDRFIIRQNGIWMHADAQGRISDSITFKKSSLYKPALFFCNSTSKQIEIYFNNGSRQILSGDEVSNCAFDKLSLKSADKYYVYYLKNGRYYLKHIYNTEVNFTNDPSILFYKNNNKYGIMTKKSVPITAAIFDLITTKKDGYFFATYDFNKGVYFLVDNKGRPLLN